MNWQLRKAINGKAMLRRKYYKYKTEISWEAFRKQRKRIEKTRFLSIFMKDVTGKSQNVSGKP